MGRCAWACLFASARAQSVAAAGVSPARSFLLSRWSRGRRKRTGYGSALRRSGSTCRHYGLPVRSDSERRPRHRKDR
eukprot:11797543-Alexandrium_andersonii.AAC.1